MLFLGVGEGSTRLFSVLHKPIQRKVNVLILSNLPGANVIVPHHICADVLSVGEFLYIWNRYLKLLFDHWYDPSELW